MTQNTDELIEHLAQEGAKPALPSPMRQGAFWLCGSLVWLTALIAMGHLRLDIGDKLKTPLYIIEISLLIGFILSAAFAALCYARPDTYQKHRIARLPFAFFLAWGLIAYLGYDPMTPSALSDGISLSGFDCSWHILLLSFVPAAFIFWEVRKGATFTGAQAGWLASCAAAALGYLAMRLAEENDNPLHLLLWHAAPVLLMSLIGMYLGRILLTLTKTVRK